MKVPIDWLKELVNFRAGGDQLAEMLSLAGLETTILPNNVLEIDVLPNRADAWSLRGIAREVSAITKFKLRPSRFKLKEINRPVKKAIRVEVRDADLCPRYMARVIEGVKVGESPEWLRRRLEQAGIRAINNIVDVTNYLLLELGQPMHAFDAALIKDGRLIVRRANPQEKVVTLDGKERELDTEILVIADANRVIALAGIMGGANTEINQGTTTIVLESACFDPVSIHKSAKLLKIKSESSIRFEHGVDWNVVSEALDRGAALIADLGKGRVLKGRIDEKAKEPRPKVVELRPARVNQLLGSDLTEGEMFNVLKRLGFKVSGKKVTVPSFRAADISREIDLIEEIARIASYNQIAATMPSTSFEGKMTDPEDLFRSRVREILVGCGFNEVLNYSMIGPKDLELIGLEAEPSVKIDNPMNIEESLMRTQLLAGLLKVLAYNLNRQQENVYVFELGKVFLPAHQKLPNERWKLGVLAYGSPFMSALDKGEADFAYLKGVLGNLFAALGIAKINYHSTQDRLLQPGKGAEVGKLGVVGELHAEIARRYEFKKPVYFLEIDLDLLYQKQQTARKYSSLPKYPSITRDVAMFVPPTVSHQDIVNLILTIGGELVEEAFVFDKYKDSLAYRVVYRSPERTLTDNEVSAKQAEIVRELETQLSVRVRR